MEKPADDVGLYFHPEPSPTHSHFETSLPPPPNSTAALLAFAASNITKTLLVVYDRFSLRVVYVVYK